MTVTRSIERNFQAFIVVRTETWTRTHLFSYVFDLIQRLVKTYRDVYIDTLSVVWVIFLRHFKSLLELPWFATDMLSSFWNLTLNCVNSLAMIVHCSIIFMKTLWSVRKNMIVWKSSWIILTDSLMILVKKRILISIQTTRAVVVHRGRDCEHLRFTSKRWSHWTKLRCFLLRLRCV
jgi:hypothetical protein